MKKLFIFSLFILCIFLIPKKIYALSFTDCNGISHNVVDEETAIDYNFFTLYKEGDSYNSLTGMVCRTATSSNNLQCWKVFCPQPTLYRNIDRNYAFSSNGVDCTGYNSYINNCGDDFSTCESVSVGSGLSNDITNTSLTWSRVIFNPTCYTDNFFEEVYKNSTTYNLDSILQKYNCGSSPSPSPSPSPEPETEVDFDMFETSLSLIIRFIDFIPVLFSVLIVFDIVGMLLFSRRG